MQSREVASSPAAGDLPERAIGKSTQPWKQRADCTQSESGGSLFIFPFHIFDRGWVGGGRGEERQISRRCDTGGKEHPFESSGQDEVVLSALIEFVTRTNTQTHSAASGTLEPLPPLKFDCFWFCFFLNVEQQCYQTGLNGLDETPT